MALGLSSLVPISPPWPGGHLGAMKCLQWLVGVVVERFLAAESASLV
jgi:hypothetical protein